MLFLVWLRTKFTPTTINSSSLNSLKHPIYTVDVENSQLNTLRTSQKLEDFFLYSNYTDIFGVGYDSLYDYQSPVYFNPPNCHLNNSFVIPTVASPIIAVVGQQNSVTKNTVSYLEIILANQALLGLGTQFKIQQYESQAQLNDYISSQTYLQPDPGVCFGFQIQQNNQADYDVSLYFFDKDSFSAKKGAGIPSQLKPEWTISANVPKLQDYQDYSLNGYSFIQNVIANMILRESTNTPTASISIMAIPMQINQAIQDKFIQIWWMFSNVILFAYLIPMYTMVFYIVKEKESRAKESMRMMGLTDFPYWASWFCYYTIINTITAISSVAVLSINVIIYSSKLQVFAFIWLFGQSLFGQIMMIQALFQKSKFAGIVSTVVYIGLTFVEVPVEHPEDPKNLKRLFSIIPEVNIYLIGQWLIQFECEGFGVHKNNAWNEFDNFNYNEGLWLFAAGFVVFMILGIYMDAVIPTEYGSKKHPCFMFMPSSYTCCRKRNQNFDIDRENLDTIIYDTEVLEYKNMSPENYEPVPSEVLKQELDGSYLRIQDLEKTYENGFHAVKGLNIKMYQNQIFALLGQNGAGKSTTISMLTGLINNSKGSAKVFDLDMFKQADQVRQFMGVCPQHDILFEFLTPEEHLSIFYDFKGGDLSKKDKEIEDLIQDVGLQEDRNRPAGYLSGGSKRKLSVAIAMCAGSKLVLLDEPTAGMDITARRALWEMLKNYRRDKIIILTTHYMDEADVLGDRIGIMAHGQMKCLGSSLFLKNRFGAGYKLTIVKQNKGHNKRILPYLQENLGNVELISEVSSEISFSISKAVANKFQEFFKNFDQDLTQLDIISYAISITTLEEVFLYINKELNVDLGQNQVGETLRIEQEHNNDLLISDRDPFENDNYKNSQNSQSVLLKANVNNSYQSSSHSSLRFSKITTDNQIVNSKLTERFLNESTICSNIQALLQKRYRVYKRDRMGLACEVIVPFIMVLAGCLITKLQFLKTSQPRMLSTDLYPAPQRILMNENNILDSGPGNISPSTLFLNLPNSDTAFQATYTDQKNFTQFYADVYNFRNDGSPKPYRFGSYQVYRADNFTQIYQINSFLNLTSQDVSSLYPQFMYQSIIKTATGNPNFNFQVTTVPFPTIFAIDQRSKLQNSLEFSFMVSIGIAMIPCVMVSFILIERSEGLKHMQLISGMNLLAYWISNLISDIVKVYIPCILMILTSIAFKVNYPYIWLLFLLLPLALVPFSYLTTFMFRDDTSGQIVTLSIHFFACAIMGLLVFTMQAIPQTFILGDKLRWICCVVPTYALINGILWSSSGSQIVAIRQSDSSFPQIPSDIWAWENLGGDLAVLIAHFIVDSFLLALIELGVFNFILKIDCNKIPIKTIPNQIEDDVLAEEIRARQTNKDVIKINDFRKVFTSMTNKPTIAVENVSFGLEYGECFAILGANGAGKTTTFKCMTSELLPTDGLIQIEGYNICTEFSKARKLIGYCPQDNSIFALLTVEEHLYFFAKLKGIPFEREKDVIEKAIIELNLSDHRKKLAGTLSGGNKRKLSVAIATLGNPPIILLDEPSAGMDPEARRFMWSAVANISQRDKQSAVILTTHSMEEAEALSTKMGILAQGGTFKCYGSAQHIKDKNSTGYEIEIKIQKPTLTNIQDLCLNLGFKEDLDDRIDLDSAIIKAKLSGVSDLAHVIANQISYEGLGSELSIEAQQKSNTVRVRNLILFYYTMMQGLMFITFIAEHFEVVELYEQCGEFFKLRIPRQDKSIGFLFGLIEAEKRRLCVSEYAVSQTSLEQIFQTFVSKNSRSKKSYKFKIGSNRKLVLAQTI